MTIIVGYQHKDFAVLASDRRCGWENSNGKKITLSDKLIKSQGGDYYLAWKGRINGGIISRLHRISFDDARRGFIGLPLAYDESLSYMLVVPETNQISVVQIRGSSADMRPGRTIILYGGKNRDIKDLFYDQFSSVHNDPSATVNTARTFIQESIKLDNMLEGVQVCLAQNGLVDCVYRE